MASHRHPERPNASLGAELSINVSLVPRFLLSGLQSEMAHRPLVERTGVEVRTLLQRHLGPILGIRAAILTLAVFVPMGVADFALPNGLPDVGYLLALSWILWTPLQMVLLNVIAVVVNRSSRRHEPIGNGSRLALSIRLAPPVAALVSLAIAVPLH